MKVVSFQRLWSLLCATALTCASSPSFAVTWDANGGTGGNFSTAANWVGDVLPGGNDLATINSNSSAAAPVTLASGTITVDNVDLGPSTASFMTVNGGTLLINGTSTADFKIGVGATEQSVFTLSSGTVEFGFAGTYTDSNDFDIGKNGNGRYVQTGGSFLLHADDFKVADSAGGTGLADVSGGSLFVADGFSISDNAGGTGTLNISGNAVVVSGNSGGLASNNGTNASGYISIANNGGTGALNISGNGAMYGKKLEYRGEPGASATVTIGGTGGKLIISQEHVDGIAGFGDNQNVFGEEEGATGQITVQESGLLAIENPTDNDYSDGFALGRSGGSAALTVGGTNARVVIPQRLLLGSGGSDMDLVSGDPGAATPGTGSMTVSAGGHVVTSELHVGVTGSGTLTQTGGTIVAKNGDDLYADAGFLGGTKGEDLYIGTQQGSNGVYNHSGGSISTNDDFIIGHFGNGAYNMSGTALVDGSGWIVLGNEEGSTGVLSISGGAFNQSGGDLEIGDAGVGTFDFSGGTMNVSGYTAIGHRQGSGVLNFSGTAILNTPDLKILMGKEGNITQSGVLSISGNAGQINVANSFTMDESGLGNENKIVANLTTSGITTINVGTTALIELGALEIKSDAGVYKPKAGDQFVLIDAAAGWDGASAFKSVSADVTLNSADDILFHGAGFTGAGGSANKYEIRVTHRGDFDVDMNVDGSDLAKLVSSLGTAAGATYATGDADEDGDVDGGDFLSWQRGFSTATLANGVATAVPEPAALAMVLTALACGLHRNRNRGCQSGRS